MFPLNWLSNHINNLKEIFLTIYYFAFCCRHNSCIDIQEHNRKKLWKAKNTKRSLLIAWCKNNILTNTKLLQGYQVSLSFPVSLSSQKSTLFTVYFTSRENTQERVVNNCIHLRVHITFCSKSMVYSLRVLELLPSSKQLQCRLEISQYSCAFWGCHGYLHSAYGFCSPLTLWSPVPKLICLWRVKGLKYDRVFVLWDYLFTSWNR